MSVRDAAAGAVARVRLVGQRLALGTGLLLHGLGDRLAPRGWGALLVRCGGALLGLAFAGRLLARAPHLVYAVPLVWALAVWHVSDSSATPPPGDGAPRDGKGAGHGDGQETTLVRREGMSIYLTPDADNPGRTHVAVERDTP